MSEDKEQLVSPFLSSSPFPVVAREEWGARNPKHVHPMNHPVHHVVCTFTRTNPCYSKQSCKHFVKRFQKYHQAVKKRIDISYNFLIGSDGTVYEGRGWNASTELYYFIPKGEPEYEGVHIAFIGTFDQERSAPPVMFQSMQSLIDLGVKNSYIDKDYEMHLL